MSLAVAVCVAQPLIGQSEQGFQYIQKFSGLFSPGITVIFLMGMFWKRITAAGALASALGSAAFSVGFAIFWPSRPFMDRIGIVFLMCLALTYFVSLRGAATNNDRSVSLDNVSFATKPGFIVAALGVVLILIGLYTTWW
ncbi:sodium:solute symporter family transporter [Paraglaciecola arctica]|uniref:sodium:solute symporter family transporter n=1 Tax=Paraglaciecola arctica TaxID=1128911 RepID=UPI00339D32F5